MHPKFSQDFLLQDGTHHHKFVLQDLSHHYHQAELGHFVVNGYAEAD